LTGKREQKQYSSFIATSPYWVMAPPAGCSWRHIVRMIRTTLAQEKHHVSVQNLKSRTNSSKSNQTLQPWRKNEPDLERSMSAEQKRNRLREDFFFSSEVQLQCIFRTYNLLILQNAGAPQVTFLVWKRVVPQQKNSYSQPCTLAKFRLLS
jgi:hypothetical protein